jgi:hypothetical protein
LASLITEKYGSRVFENMVLRRILALQRERDWSKFHNKEVYNYYS